MKQKAAADMRAYRVRTGRQETVPIPVKVLAALLDADALVIHLGAEMVEAIREAGKR